MSFTGPEVEAVPTALRVVDLSGTSDSDIHGFAGVLGVAEPLEISRTFEPDQPTDTLLFRWGDLNLDLVLCHIDYLKMSEADNTPYAYGAVVNKMLYEVEIVKNTDMIDPTAIRVGMLDIVEGSPVTTLPWHESSARILISSYSREGLHPTFVGTLATHRVLLSSARGVRLT